MSKIKVCHFSSVHSLTDTRVFFRECLSLAKTYDVTYIGIGDFSGYRNGICLIGIKKPKTKFIRFVYTLLKVFTEAVKVDAFVYHIHDAEMIPFGIVLALAGKKVIYDIHENTFQDILLKPWLPLFVRKLFANIYNAMLFIGTAFMHYIVVIAAPKFLKLFFVRDGQFSIIQNFANLHALRKFIVTDRSKIKGNNLFYIGMIKDMYYDINTLFEAMYLLKQKGVDTHLHCIGYFGEGTNKLFTDYKNWDEIKSAIIFYGFKDFEDAYEISKICKIGICLKNQPSPMLVSHERKLFEYMAVGLPSVFCNTHIYSQLNQQCEIGFAVDISDPYQIADAIEKMLTSKELLDGFSMNNRYWSANEFNWETEEIKLLELYEKLVIS